MGMKQIKLFSIFFIIPILCGCVTAPKPIAFSTHPQENTKIGVLLSEHPKAGALYTGSVALLDWGIIEAANVSLNKHLKTLSFDDDHHLFFEQAEAVLRKRGYLVEIVNERMPFEFAIKLKTHENGITQNDYTIYKEKYGLKHLLIVRINGMGTTRPYSGFIPTAPPVATATIWGELVDLESKNVLWYQTVTANKVIPEPWDEKNSGYANLTNSIYSVLNDASKKIFVLLQYPEAKASLDKHRD